MKFSSKDWAMYYRTIYRCSNVGEEPSIIIRGTFVQMLMDFDDVLSACPLLAWIDIPGYLWHYTLLAIKRLKEEAKKPRAEKQKIGCLNSLEDMYTLSIKIKSKNAIEALKDNYVSNRKEKINKANNINALRKQIYTNNMELKGNLVSGNLLTFGNEINEALNLIFPELTELKTSFLSRGNCVIIKDINSLQDKLSKLFYVDVKVILN